MDYKELVGKKIEDEYRMFKDNLLNESNEDIYSSAYTTVFYNEMFEMLCNDSNHLEEKHYKQLYDNNNILEYLWEAWLDSGICGVDNWNVLEDFIADNLSTSERMQNSQM